MEEHQLLNETQSTFHQLVHPLPTGAEGRAMLLSSLEYIDSSRSRLGSVSHGGWDKQIMPQGRRVSSLQFSVKKQ